MTMPHLIAVALVIWFLCRPGQVITIFLLGLILILFCPWLIVLLFGVGVAAAGS